MKKHFILGFVTATVISASIVLASEALQNVFTSKFPITVNGQTYTSDSPILNYQGRTYLQLRDFGNATGINVDFKDNTILVDNNKYMYTKYFLQDAYMILHTLSDMNNNNNQLIEQYHDFITDSDQYASANITNTTQTNEKIITVLQENVYLKGFQSFGESLELDQNQQLTNLFVKIHNYIANTSKFDITITDAMYLKATTSQVSEEWSKLFDDYQEIKNELTALTASI